MEEEGLPGIARSQSRDHAFLIAIFFSPFWASAVFVRIIHCSHETSAHPPRL